MGFFSDLKGMKAVQKIAHGGVDKLSLSQIVCLITNMPDAKRNLTEAQFNDVYDLYKNYRKCTTKLPMDADGYVNICINIIFICSNGTYMLINVAITINGPNGIYSSDFFIFVIRND